MRGTSGKRNVAVASDRLYRAVRNVIQEAHGVVSRVANWAMVETNWCPSFLIVEDEQTFPIRNALRSELSWTRYRYSASLVYNNFPWREGMGGQGTEALTTTIAEAMDDWGLIPNAEEKK